MSETLYKENDNKVGLDNLKDTDGTPLNAATVTATLLDRDDLDGTPVVAAQTLNKVAGEDGKYEGVWDKGLLATVAEGEYVLRYNAVESGTDFEKDVIVEVRVRTVGIND
jgi:hypothetical protein